MQKNTLIFDLDGTLADTAPDLIGTLNRITAPHHLPPVEVSSAGQVVGQGAKAMIDHVFKLAGVTLDENTREALFQDFLDDYSANLSNETVLFDGVENALEILKSQGFRFCVCTNKMEAFANPLLEQLSIAHWFDAVTGGNTFSFRKPDPRHLVQTLKRMDSASQQAIMVGDSSTDINAAKNAGIPSVAVSFGYSDNPVSSLGATAIIDHYSELVDTIEKIQNPDQAAAI